MNVGDVIWESTGYCIKVSKQLPNPDYLTVGGEVQSGEGFKAFQFCLYKDDQPFKYFSTVSKYPYDYDVVKSEVITALKKCI